MAVWTPDLVTAEDRADSGAMADARDIHEATIELIRIMLPYLLKEADTRDLRLWGFIYVILVFMRSLKTRPDLREWLGSAFHAELLAPFLNMLLREDEARGAAALEGASQSEVVTICSLLNERKKPDMYGFSTEDNVRKYLREQEEQRKAGLVKSTAASGEPSAEEVTAEDATATPERSTVPPDDQTINPEETTVAADEPMATMEDAVSIPEGTQTTVKATTVTPEESTAETEETEGSDTRERGWDTGSPPDWEIMYADTLPEHSLLCGLFFAREAESEPCDKSLVVVEKAECENGNARQQDAQTKDIEAGNTPNEDDQKESEAEEARLAEKGREEREAKEAQDAEALRQEGLLRDPPIFPKGWLKMSKYGYDEMQAFNYVQSAEMYHGRSIQILRLAAQLVDHFFDFETDEEGRRWISVPGASSVPKPDPSKKMPEIIERDGGVRVVYVCPAFHAADVEKGMKKGARRDEREKEKARQKEQKHKEKENEAQATTDVTTTVDEKAEGEGAKVCQATLPKRARPPLTRLNSHLRSPRGRGLSTMSTPKMHRRPWMARPWRPARSWRTKITSHSRHLTWSWRRPPLLGKPRSLTCYRAHTRPSVPRPRRRRRYHCVAWTARKTRRQGRRCGRSSSHSSCRNCRRRPSHGTAGHGSADRGPARQHADGETCQGYRGLARCK